MKQEQRRRLVEQAKTVVDSGPRIGLFKRLKRLGINPQVVLSAAVVQSRSENCHDCPPAIEVVQAANAVIRRTN